MWGNSQQCDETDNEFQRLAALFESNNFNMRLLIQEFFSSPIFTGADYLQTHDSKEFLVSVTRANHFCRALEQRQRELNSLNGTTGADTELCEGFATSPEFGLLSSDNVSRGDVPLVQNAKMNIFDTKSIDLSCINVDGEVFSNNNNKIFDTDEPAEEIIAQLVQNIMGLPTNHDRYETTYQQLQKTYDIYSHNTACALSLIHI